jgi:hypothetical protein
MAPGKARAAIWSGVLLGALLSHRPAWGQCGAKRTSCTACHDGARAPLPAEGAWHTDHAFADLCASCHGGKGDANEESLAHVGLSDPRAEDKCASCHAGDTAAFLERYRSPRRPAVAADDAGLPGGATAGGSRARPMRPVHGESTPNLVLAAVVLAIAGFGAALVVRHERRLRHPQPRLHPSTEE